MPKLPCPRTETMRYRPTSWSGRSETKSLLVAPASLSALTPAPANRHQDILATSSARAPEAIPPLCLPPTDSGPIKPTQAGRRQLTNRDQCGACDADPPRWQGLQSDLAPSTYPNVLPLIGHPS